MQSLLQGLQTDFESMMGALRVLPLDLGLREECAQLLKPISGSGKNQVSILPFTRSLLQSASAMHER